MFSESIQTKIQDKFEPIHFVLENESHMHAGPATESHFKIILVARAFEAVKRVQRHRLVYDTLAKELSSGVHALALHLFTPSEWQAQQARDLNSPQCLGGSKSNNQS